LINYLYERLGPIRAEQIRSITVPLDNCNQRRSQSKAQSRYSKNIDRIKSNINESNTKFDGFQDDDEIIINPKFGQTLKKSLKRSKR
jgi:hypothetical protein